ncbi:MAG: hypothetical protein ACRBB2_00710 [Nitrosopumilus sp.]
MDPWCQSFYDYHKMISDKMDKQILEGVENQVNEAMIVVNLERY